MVKQRSKIVKEVKGLFAPEEWRNPSTGERGFFQSVCG
jgi:hypothetical protein